jgi:D-amino-acid dehydrogenase
LPGSITDKSAPTDARALDADHVVVALGPWSPELLERFGFRVRMVRMRGYHRHFAGGAPLSYPLFWRRWRAACA